MNDEFKKLAVILKGEVTEMNPSSTTVYNPFETEINSSQISMKDVVDHKGELKPFSILSNELGLSIDMYKLVGDFLCELNKQGITGEMLLQIQRPIN